MKIIKFPTTPPQKQGDDMDAIVDFLKDNGIAFTQYPHPSEMTDEQLRSAPGLIKKRALEWRSKNLSKLDKS